MRGLILSGLLISTIVVCVLSENDAVSGQTQADTSAVVVTSDQLTHGHRSKRSPYDPLIPGLLLGKSLFLLGAFAGKKFGGRGWGWRPRPKGWGWKPAPVVVHHHSHGGWGGWEEPEVHHGGWGGWRR